MSDSGEIAEQVVRLSIHGAEVCLKLTGAAAVRITALIYTIMKDQYRTAGKIRLASMLKSGKELNVFTIPAKDLSAFAAEAKKYGVLYCALKEKDTGEDGTIDVMVYKDDAAKINRIVERISISTVETKTIDGQGEAEKTTENPTIANPGKESQSGHISNTKEKTGEGIPETARRSVRKDIDDLRRIRKGELIKEEKVIDRLPYMTDKTQPPKNIKKGRTR